MNSKFFDMADFEKLFALRNHVLVQFAPWKRHIWHFLGFLKSMVWNWKFHYVPVFELKKIQRVRFWFKNFTTRQTLDWKSYNPLDFELKIFRLVSFWKIVCNQKSRFSSCYFVKTTYFTFFVLCEKHGFELKISLRASFWIEENTIFTFFCAFWKAWFWIEMFITCQILNWKKYNASDFDLKILQRVRL